MMRSFLMASALVASASTVAYADLKVGDSAPQFTAQGYLAGEPFDFDLSQSLQEGPVVLYFFPAAFTPGCNIEAALFAENAAEFEAEGATLIGATAGNTDRLAEFSEEHCASAFPVAAVERDVVRDYEVGMTFRPGWTNRTSMVIAPDGTILHTFTDSGPNDHVNETLTALRDWKASQGE